MKHSNNNNLQQAKTWWGPVWRGLVVDPAGKHYRQMGTAFWLFVYLVIHADRRDGHLHRKYETIAGDMGISVRSVRRWLERLAKYKYVSLRQTGRSQVIHICKWKTLLSNAKAAKAGHSDRPEVFTQNGQSVSAKSLSTGKAADNHKGIKEN